MATRKDDLAREAARLFAERGFHGTSMDALAQGLGVQKGSLYSLIGSKQELLFQTMREGARAFHAALDAVPDDAPAVDRVRLALRGHLSVVSEQLDVATVFTREWRYLEDTYREEILGEVEVRALFRASRLGVIAGCYVTSGVIRRNAQVRVVRDGTVIYETTIASLKRFKDDVREVQEGFECGILLDGFNDVKEGDVLEAFETQEIERTDLSVAGNGGAPDESEADDSE